MPHQIVGEIGDTKRLTRFHHVGRLKDAVARGHPHERRVNRGNSYRRVAGGQLRQLRERRHSRRNHVLVRRYPIVGKAIPSRENDDG